MNRAEKWEADVVERLKKACMKYDATFMLITTPKGRQAHVAMAVDDDITALNTLGSVFVTMCTAMGIDPIKKARGLDRDRKRQGFEGEWGQ